jgi:hypothetical protein
LEKLNFLLVISYLQKQFDLLPLMIMKNLRFHTTTGSTGGFAGKQFSLSESLIKNKNTFIVFAILFQLFAPLSHTRVMGQCKPVITQNFSSAPASVEARANWSFMNSPGSLSSPESSNLPLWGDGSSLQSFSDSFWMQNVPYDFSFSYFAETGTSSWHIDFNRNGFVDMGEQVSIPSSELENKGFTNLKLSASTGLGFDFSGMVLVRNLKINGYDFGGLMGAGPAPMELNYTGVTGSLNDILVTGNVTFSNLNPSLMENAPNFSIQLSQPAERTLCELPATSHPTGTYEGLQEITISYPDSSASIYYTTTGNIPVIGTVFTILYTGPFQVNESTTVRAIAVKEGLAQSPELVSYLSITGSLSSVTAPIIYPGSGIFTHYQQVTMSCETEEATIYYTTTGNVPVPGTVFTKIYSEPFEVHSSIQIRAIAMKEGMITSPQAISNITILAPTPVVATPQISPGSGFIPSNQVVTITCATPGSTIYYTTNGNVPLLSPFPNSFTRIYTGPFLLNTRGLTTIRAIAVAPSAMNSPVAVANLTVINAGSRQSYDGGEKEITEEDIKVFPNPSAGSFFVQLPSESEQNLAYSVISPDGKEVVNGEFIPGQTAKLDLETLKAGLYLLRIKTGNGVRTLRLAKA